MGSSRKKHYASRQQKITRGRYRAQPVPESGREYRNPGVEREIHSDRLTSGLPYQRAVEPKEVDRLVQEWDERLLDPVIVSFRDGRFNLIDGQHRVAAMCRMNGGNGVMVNCKVYYGLTYADEAELFYKLDKAKKRLSLSQSTNALAESGTDAEILEIKKLTERCGFVWALGKRQGKTGNIVATRALVNAYRLLGKEGFSRMLTLMRDCWEGDPRSLTAAVISGMALFMQTYGDDFTDTVFVRRFSQIDPDEINRRGRADVSTSSMPLRYARVILEQYNKQRGGKKLAYRFKG